MKGVSLHFKMDKMWVLGVNFRPSLSKEIFKNEQIEIKRNTEGDILIYMMIRET